MIVVPQVFVIDRHDRPHYHPHVQPHHRGFHAEQALAVSDYDRYLHALYVEEQRHRELAERLEHQRLVARARLQQEQERRAREQLAVQARRKQQLRQMREQEAARRADIQNEATKEFFLRLAIANVIVNSQSSPSAADTSKTVTGRPAERKQCFKRPNRRDAEASSNSTTLSNAATTPPAAANPATTGTTADTLRLLNSQRPQAAAVTLQRWVRLDLHHTLDSLRDLRHLRSELDVAESAESRVGRLRTMTKKDLLWEEERLTRILVRADAVPSGGSRKVRDVRRALVAEVERRLGDIERVRDEVEAAIAAEVEGVSSPAADGASTASTETVESATPDVVNEPAVDARPYQIDGIAVEEHDADENTAVPALTASVNAPLEDQIIGTSAKDFPVETRLESAAVSSTPAESETEAATLAVEEFDSVPAPPNAREDDGASDWERV
ncbi:hypothetical protein HK101_008747 [Irineochytrium annulatum]|nr:hypothetical protein HK101_008747 [Irineochytrium annulatum]